MSVLRVGMLGCGGIANRHAPILMKLPERAEMVAFCDTLKDRAEDFRGRYSGGKGAVDTDFAEMHDRAGLDVVYICLPPFAHTDEVQLAAKHKAHVFIEKPIALTMGAALETVDAVE
ncbi:MAG: Gfo/Idh/MocA family oxidoreductase [Armatimonadetes bacterium]|nr:Gfo/Idh/MocA family oxidoreductase [Armatimonadota bacterium]